MIYVREVTGILAWPYKITIYGVTVYSFPPEYLIRGSNGSSEKTRMQQMHWGSDDTMRRIFFHYYDRMCSQMTNATGMLTRDMVVIDIDIIVTELYEADRVVWSSKGWLCHYTW